MRLILTHEQADFDAIASLLGAYLLDEQAVPVLPRRVNRNVRAFLTLYGTELPFLEQRDLPTRAIEGVTLVDTQSLTRVKGMSRKTRVQVVDHHTSRDDLPKEWQVMIEPTGATTTLFTEWIQERGLGLTLVQATLLLIGIYEDTGSLTYVGTTPRDVRAAAYLLEQGASLRLAADYLKHTLSPAQRMLYDVLLANTEIHSIAGQIIALASADVQGLEEEISTIAHKLRDFLDPNALILLVTTRAGIQLIARSTSDRVNVADIAAHFGGGGHERAAAGLIRERTLEDVKAELLNILPRYVRPAITVAEIMSRGPQVLRPDTPAEEAARLMQRHGHEGYPVVDGQKVVGLLTRRAVDRAQAHRLNLPAASLMEAGEVIIHPEDSIDTLQQVMTESGWGQVPVVDRQTGEIIGIVTRTDLLKTLAPEPRVPGRHNFADRLDKFLPSTRLGLLKLVAEIADELQAALYVVGGFVRDLLLERPSLDFDLVVEGDAIALAKTLAKRYGGRVTSHARFGTAKWHIEPIIPHLLQRLQAEGRLPSSASAEVGEHQTAQVNDLPRSLDLISARTEFYTHPTALPTVERGSIKLDLHRRDFTINTLALRLDGHHYGELHDYWGGWSDLNQGIVRVLHSLSFVDDPTRILRAVRFEQRFGFHIEARTMQLLREARSLLDRVSGDRIRHELDAILDEENAHLMLARLHELDLLSAIHPDLTWDDWLGEKIRLLTQVSPEKEWGLKPSFRRVPLKRALGYVLMLIRYPRKKAQSIAKRLKLPRLLNQPIFAACEIWPDLPRLQQVAPSEFTFRLDVIPPLARYALYLAVDEEAMRQRLLTYVIQWQHVAPRTTGDNLRELGVPPGPQYRQILDALRAAWLDGEITNPDQERQRLEQLIRPYRQ
jgi:tRNA nucleotidyltransferase (CCA-adding enzyme)